MATTAAKETPLGFGSMKRKEDARFIRGQGTYLDDIVLPGMLHGAILRSPYAHAKILSIDTSKALAHPEGRRGHHRQGPRDARARLDADDLLRHPGRARRRQGPLPGPGGRVRHRRRRYSARDALPLIDVEYEPLPARRQRAQGARRRRAADPRRQGRPERQPREPDLGGRRRGGDRPRLRRGRHRRERDMIYPRCHPAPLETCGMIADFNPETGQLDIYNGNQAPNAHRTVYAQVAGPAPST